MSRSLSHSCPSQSLHRAGRLQRRHFLAAALLAPTLLFGQNTAVKPKLVLVITIDQFRYDYFTRFQKDYKSGLARLWNQGAVFTQAHYEHFPTVTAIGHATILTGSIPAIHGIVGNEWYDRKLKLQVTSVEDPAHKLTGAPGTGASPRNLLVSTVGDELKMANPVAGPKVIGISIKDRSAILPVGHTADAALWFEDAVGGFVSSTYYGGRLPAWVEEFNRSRWVDQFAGAQWKPLLNPRAEPFLTMEAKPGPVYWRAMERTPWGNDLLIALARKAVEAEKLGQRDSTDLLSVSFSANDYIGHDHGPDSERVHDISVRTDRQLGELFAFLDKQVGMRNILVVMTADHGASPVPEVNQERKMPGGRVMTSEAMRTWVQKQMTEWYGEGKWVLGYSGPAPYLNHDLILEKKLDPAEVRRRLAEAILAIPHVLRVYTPERLAIGATRDDQIDRRVRNGYFAARTSDLFIVAEPYWIFDRIGTGHGTPHNYDSHVPIVFLGPGIRPGKYPARVAVTDIAPTLASILEIATPSGSVGRVLDEALVH